MRAIAFIALLLAQGCAQYQKLEVDVFYKRDIGIEINGETYEGVTVVPRSTEYNIVLEPKGEMDLVLIRSCHREDSFEKNSKKLWTALGNNRFQYTYQPRPMEAEKTCPLRIEVYEAKKGRHSWALLDFEHPDYLLPAVVTCNGVTKNYYGVSVCQAKAGLVQRIQFPAEIVDFAPPEPEGCAEPQYKNGAFEWEISGGECVYHVRNQDGAKHRMVTVGYSGVLVREAQ